eukprot:TRINITY_DN9070_c0_g1_i3.p1 TRINITY_DN9070_c0_g1~~TRINITY_DN9070_c0_g1_i3.p1  ORF type:complete len:197 (+),score=41.34 TRINITY_DN9070_c0_g1_i3:96-686(+)
MEQKQLKFVCQGGKEFFADKRIAQFSGFVSNIIQDAADDEIIPLPTIEIESLQFIVKFMEAHNYEIPKYSEKIRSEKVSENLPPIDVELLKEYDLTNLAPVVNAAYFLDIPSLIDMLSIRIACDFYIGKEAGSLEKLKKKYNITEDLTPEKEEELLERFPYLREYLLTNLSQDKCCLLYTSPSPRDRQKSRMPSSA